MNQVFATFGEFWNNRFINRATGQLIRGFPEGSVPVPAVFPFIIYPVMRPSFAQSVIASASIVDRRPTMPGFFGLVSDVLGQIGEVIPEEGTFFEIADGGMITLHRGSNFFQTMGDPDDPAIVRGIVNLVIGGFMV